MALKLLIALALAATLLMMVPLMLPAHASMDATFYQAPPPATMRAPTDDIVTTDTATSPSLWVIMDLVVPARAGGQQQLRIKELSVQQPVLCRFLASLGPSAVEQSLELCASDDDIDSTQEPNTTVDPRRLQGSSSAVPNTTNCNSNASLDVTCAAAGMVPVENAAATPSSDQGGCCTCPAGTTAAYDDEHLGFRFRSEDITTSADDGSLQWDAAAPTGLVFTRRKPTDPFDTGGVNEGNFSEPSRVVPLGVAAGLHFESGPDAAYDQAMFSNLKIAIGAEHTFFAAVTPAAVSTGFFSTILGFRAGDGQGGFGFLAGTSFNGIPNAGPGQENEGAAGILFTDECVRAKTEKWGELFFCAEESTRSAITTVNGCYIPPLLSPLLPPPLLLPPLLLPPLLLLVPPLLSPLSLPLLLLLPPPPPPPLFSHTCLSTFAAVGFHLASTDLRSTEG